MLRSIGSFQIDPKTPEFSDICRTPRKYDRSFRIDNNLLINFDPSSGGGVELSAVNPIVGSPHYVLKPFSLGGARWYSIECPINCADIEKLGQVVPYLDIASPQSVSCHANLRLFYQDGRSEDISSLQIEIKRNRVRQTFPISLADIRSTGLESIDRAVVIFFIEARDVKLELYGYSISGLDRQEVIYNAADLMTLREATQKEGSLVKHNYAILSGKTDVVEKRITHHEMISDGVFVDFETADDRSVNVQKTALELEFTFENMQEAEWRNFEFRFEDITNTGSILAIVRMEGSTLFSKNIKEASALLVLREYDENFEWNDTILREPLNLQTKPDEQTVMLDLSPILADDRLKHTFGLLLFLPEDVISVNVSEMEAFVFDRRA
ncbi:hypothetical protein [uncultured Cohaesibacter sp.]|uniref:hypothetical protein n=1 Tax=uncultured Cohaesibacter sp. TaxID=1002546 RepID=UPI002AABB0BF|nr:hypothetical protein [uncultured Cohaesibacter sp.]